MNCAEFIDILKSGQPILLRRHSKEYVWLTENSLSVVAENKVLLCIWLAADFKSKRYLLNNFDSNWNHRVKSFRETFWFLNRWQEMREARGWSTTINFPGLNEIATFVYLTLIPEYWTIYLEVEGKPAEEALPLIEHENLHSDTSGYDL
jgi:hypothetical protein